MDFKIVTFAAIAFAALSAPAAAQSWGAIAYSPSTGAAGWSADHSNEVDAELTALGFCQQHADDCVSAINFHDACGAVARGDGVGWGADWGLDGEIAQDEALTACYAHGNSSCSIVRWQCSYY